MTWVCSSPPLSQAPEKGCRQILISQEGKAPSCSQFLFGSRASKPVHVSCCDQELIKFFMFCVSVFSDRPCRQEEADGLWLSPDGCHHVCAHRHALHQGIYIHFITAPSCLLPCRESFNKIFYFHTGSESIDPIREHLPDFLCHLYLWTWTL